jgi:hypothetical protein
MPETVYVPNTVTDDDGLFEFANISPKRTGLPFVIWISPSMCADHDVRVHVSYDTRVGRSDLIPVALRPEVQIVGDGTLKDGDLDLLKQWVDLNFDLILDHWEGRIEGSLEALTLIKPLR